MDENPKKTPGTTPGHPNLLPPWQPGQSGNPNGRPKGSKNSLKSRLLKELEKEPPKEIVDFFLQRGISLEDADVAEVIAKVTAISAMKGNLQATRLIKDITYDEENPEDIEAPIIINVLPVEPKVIEEGKMGTVIETGPEQDEYGAQ